MRARHRHLNAKGFGAEQSYDARFESLAESDAVSAWTNRVSPSVGNATQSVEIRKPTFSLRGINGSSAINFSGSQFLNMPAATASDIEVYILGSHANKPWTNNYSNDLQAYIDQNHSTTVGFVAQTRPDIGSNLTGVAFNPPNTSIYLPATDATINLFSLSKTQNGNLNAWLNGGGKSTVVTTQTWVAVANQIIGAWYNGGNVARYLNGKIGMVALFKKVNTDSVRKRLEHAAAFSFKIACS